MAEGGSSCPCNGAKKKSGVFKLFRMKKKKPVCTEPTTCLKCLQNNINLSSTQNTMNVEKERVMVAECLRKQPYAHLPPDRRQMVSYPEDDIIEEPPFMGSHNPDRRMIPASGSRELGGAVGMANVNPNMMHMPIKYHPENCGCPPCKEKRYHDGLLAMDAQVILQNSLLQNTLSDTAGLVCVIL